MREILHYGRRHIFGETGGNVKGYVNWVVRRLWLKAVTEPNSAIHTAIAEWTRPNLRKMTVAYGFPIPDFSTGSVSILIYSFIQIKHISLHKTAMGLDTSYNNIISSSPYIVNG